MMTIQQKIYWIICIIKFIIKSLEKIYLNIPQQINFVGKLEEDDGATMFLITIINFSLDPSIATE